MYLESHFLQTASLKSIILVTRFVFFLEWHFALKVLTTFTFIQPKRKHLWDVKIDFGNKSKSEQEEKPTNKQNILKIAHIQQDVLKTLSDTKHKSTNSDGFRGDEENTNKRKFCDAMVNWKALCWYASLLSVIKEQLYWQQLLILN